MRDNQLNVSKEATDHWRNGGEEKIVTYENGKCADVCSQSTERRRTGLLYTRHKPLRATHVDKYVSKTTVARQTNEEKTISMSKTQRRKERDTNYTSRIDVILGCGK